MNHFNLLTPHQPAAVSYSGPHVITRRRQRRRLMVTQPLPIYFTAGQLAPQRRTHLNARGSESLWPLVTKQGKLNTLAAQFLQVRNDLALAQGVEHSVVRDVKHSPFTQGHGYVALHQRAACRIPAS